MLIRIRIQVPSQTFHTIMLYRIFLSLVVVFKWVTCQVFCTTAPQFKLCGVQEESDLDDETMFKLDAKLAAVFRSMRKGTKLDKDKVTQLRHYQMR